MTKFEFTAIDLYNQSRKVIVIEAESVELAFIQFIEEDDMDVSEVAECGLKKDDYGWTVQGEESLVFINKK